MYFHYMKYREMRPRGAAASFAECFWTLELDGDDCVAVQRVVPDGAAELIVNFATPMESLDGGMWREQPGSFLAAQITGPLMLRCAGKARILGVRFKPHGAGALLGPVMNEVTDSAVPIQDLSDVLAEDVGRAFDAEAWSDRSRAVEEALVRFDSRYGKHDELVQRAVEQFTSGQTDVAGVARLLGISSRQLERRFTRQVGLTPKLFCRMRRFQSVFQAVEQGGSRWADAAVDCGYFDQAHLIRDFKEFAGEPPSQLMAGTDLAAHFLSRSAMSHFSKTQFERAHKLDLMEAE
jgi:AraC-like DNA-binding protein